MLNTPRLSIRPMADEDLAAVFALYDDAEMREHCRPIRWASMDSARAWLAHMRARITAGEALQFVVAGAGPEAQIVGTCVLFDIDQRDRRAEIGYALGRAHWGRGLMHEALAALVDHAFTAMAMHRLDAEIDSRNQRSAASLARLGFEHEGTRRERYADDDGTRVNAAMYGLLATEWTNKRM